MPATFSATTAPRFVRRATEQPRTRKRPTLARGRPFALSLRRKPRIVRFHSDRAPLRFVNCPSERPAQGGSLMAVPSGEIVARPMVARACGCLCEFQHYAVDKYRAQRLAKFKTTRCPECVAKLVEEQRKASPLLKKGEAFRQLPPGTQVPITCR